MLENWNWSLQAPLKLTLTTGVPIPNIEAAIMMVIKWSCGSGRWSKKLPTNSVLGCCNLWLVRPAYLTRVSQRYAVQLVTGDSASRNGAKRTLCHERIHVSIDWICRRIRHRIYCTRNCCLLLRRQTLSASSKFEYFYWVVGYKRRKISLAFYDWVIAYRGREMSV